MVFNGNTERKTEHTIWKSIKNWAENWCQIVCGILFDLIYSMTSSEDRLAKFNNTLIIEAQTHVSYGWPEDFLTSKWKSVEYEEVKSGLWTEDDFSFLD